MDYSVHTILIIDDDETFRQYLRTLISRALNVTIAESENPKEAFEYLKGNKPSLILLDMQMPVMDGFTALKYLRSIDDTKNIPVIPCTALSNLELVLELSKLNISDYILKGVPGSKIIEKIVNILGKEESDLNAGENSEK
jgi:two-component system, chemotaxis family, chemotaxis protein CheY